MRRLALATVSTLALSVVALGAATAADMHVKGRRYAAPPPPPAPIYTWAGWYIGLNAGWVGSSDDSIVNTGTGAFGNGLANGDIPRALDLGYSGFLGGAQVGYNWQTGMWVYGLEADINAADAKSDTAIIGASTFSRELNWLSTFRGRVGVTPWSAPVLVYATGGLAVGETKIANGVFHPPLNAASETSDTRAGWTLGLGAEWAFAPQWSVKAEYLHVDLGDTSTTLVQPPYGTMRSEATDSLNIVRGGVNYHFVWW